ncbi:MAG: GNAT family N-acetyltransferase [Chloroflexi bacterium]|nr:GNAT family N-acetyltransferase [Chloroflexota bacterium]
MPIRPAVESDLPQLVSALAPDPGRAQLANRFAEQRVGIRSLLVMELDGKVVGTVSVSPGAEHDGTTRRLFALDVGSKYRRRGFGALLIAEVERIVAKDGHSVVRLEVSVDNHAAISLYEKFGYEKIGLPRKLVWSRGVDGHPSEDVVEISHLLRKVLTGSL